ncbi:MAG: GDSL-type esterase/lipase family protein [Eubacteriales bacterium]|jgi:lysophospholipase L1-like esterase
METEKRKRQKREGIALIALCVVAAVLLGITLWMIRGNNQDQPEPSEVPSSQDQPSGEGVSSDTQGPSPSPEPEPEPFDPFPQESAAVEDSYFDDAVFIGNSLTEGMELFGELPNATYYASTGISVNQILTKGIVDGQTVPQALASHSFGKVYVMLGINEAGMDQETFRQRYTELIDTICQTQPQAVVYIQSILPVTAKRDARGDNINNANVAALNGILREIAQEQEVYYLDVASAIDGGTGVLPAEVGGDGVHLSKKYYLVWKEYLKTHTAQPVEQEQSPSA